MYRIQEHITYVKDDHAVFKVTITSPQRAGMKIFVVDEPLGSAAGKNWKKKWECNGKRHEFHRNLVVECHGLNNPGRYIRVEKAGRLLVCGVKVWFF